MTPNGTSTNDVPRFLVIFDLPTYIVLLYNVRFLGLSWTPLPTLILDVINGRSHMIIASKYKHNLKKDFTSLCNCIVARVQWCPTLATIVFKKGAKKSKYFFKMIIEGHLCVCLDYIYLFRDAGR